MLWWLVFVCKCLPKRIYNPNICCIFLWSNWFEGFQLVLKSGSGVAPGLVLSELAPHSSKNVASQTNMQRSRGLWLERWTSLLPFLGSLAWGLFHSLKLVYCSWLRIVSQSYKKNEWCFSKVGHNFLSRKTLLSMQLTFTLVIPTAAIICIRIICALFFNDFMASKKGVRKVRRYFAWKPEITCKQL